MTWAKNYGERFSTSASQAGKRAKAIVKTCAACGTGIERRKTYCGPCYAERLQDRSNARSRVRYNATRYPL